MILLLRFWAAASDWVLIAVTAVGVVGTLLTGAGALVIGYLTFSVNRQTSALQAQVYEMQRVERASRIRLEFQAKLMDWTNRQETNERMRNLEASSLLMLRSERSGVRFWAGHESDAVGQFCFVNAGPAEAQDVRMEDATLPFSKPWHVQAPMGPMNVLKPGEKVVAYLDGGHSPHEGLLVRVSWVEEGLPEDETEVMGEKHIPQRRLSQEIYIPPREDEPKPVLQTLDG